MRPVPQPQTMPPRERALARVPVASADCGEPRLSPATSACAANFTNGAFQAKSDRLCLTRDKLAGHRSTITSRGLSKGSKCPRISTRRGTGSQGPRKRGMPADNTTMLRSCFVKAKPRKRTAGCKRPSNRSMRPPFGGCRPKKPTVWRVRSAMRKLCRSRRRRAGGAAQIVGTLAQLSLALGRAGVGRWQSSCLGSASVTAP